MIRLILKIFLAYWMAASVVIVVSDFEPHREMHHPELNDALESSLALNGQLLATAFEDGRCSEAERTLSTQYDLLAIAAADGSLLCGDTGAGDQKALAQSASRKNKRLTANHELFQLIAMPLSSHSSKYVLLLRTNYSSALEIYGLLPGKTTIAISCVVTLFLAILVALPIRRLRRAAQQIGAGKLDARVDWGKAAQTLHGFKGRDDIAKLVQDFNNMAERLQALAEAQRILLRNASHELRSPLARLSVGLGFARREASSTMLVHLDRIKNESKKLNDLIGQILALSQLETIQRIDDPEVVSLSRIVTNILPDLKYEAKQKRSAITTSLATGCTVRGNSELLRAAIENVVRNAICYVQEDGTIHVETCLLNEGNRQFAIVRVSDNGPGIPEGELTSVLKPFYRANRSLHWQKAGFGIGLAIANRAAIVHSGTINIRNREEGGLTVEICIPLSPKGVRMLSASHPGHEPDWTSLAR